MFLARYTVDLTGISARKLVLKDGEPDCYAIHCAVEEAYEGEGKRGEGRLLWRLDGDVGPKRVLWVSSPGMPSDPESLAERLGGGVGKYQIVDTDALYSKLEDGQRFSFRLCANPSYADGRKRVAHTEAGCIKAWLVGSAALAGARAGEAARRRLSRKDRSVDNGFSVVDGPDGLRVSNARRVRFRRKGDDVEYFSACYDGVLEVTDAGKLKAMLENGIGRQKGFGCGLMTLAPVA